MNHKEFRILKEKKNKNYVEFSDELNDNINITNTTYLTDDIYGEKEIIENYKKKHLKNQNTSNTFN